MALIGFEGFENASSQRNIVGYENVDQLVTTDPRTGTTSLLLDGSIRDATLAVTAQDGDTFILGMGIKFLENLSSDRSPLIEFRSPTGAIQARLVWTGSGFGWVEGTSTTVLSAAAALSINTWAYLEVKVTVFYVGTPVGAVEFRLNGTTIGSVSSIDTVQGAGGIAGAVITSEFNTGRSFEIDDVYVADTTGPAPFNDFLGPVKVKRLGPTGAGNYSDGVGSDGNSVDNHLLVDDVGATVDTTDFVRLSAADRETYTAANLGAGEVPLAVRVSAHMESGNIAEEYDGTLRIGTTDYDAGDGKSVAGWNDWYFTTNPSTAAAWAEDDLDGAEFGIVRDA